jgi:hypothetical protein
MSISKDVEQSLWWLLNKLRQDSNTYDSQTFIIDVTEKEDIYNQRQQQKLLERLEADGVLERKPFRTQIEALAVTTFQRDYWDADKYKVTLLQPDFDSLYDKYSLTNKPIPLWQKPLETRIDPKITYKDGTISQGNNWHTFKHSEELVILLRVLWQKRRIVKEDDSLSKAGKSTKISSLQVQGTRSLSEARIKDLCNVFNRTMKRKGIKAKISVGKTLTLEVQESDSQKVN